MQLITALDARHATSTSTRWGRAALATLFWAVALGLAAYSSHVSWRYGLEFWGGTDPITRIQFACGFVLLDLAKFLLVAEAAGRWNTGKHLSASLLFVPVMLFSGFSVLAAWNVGSEGQAQLVGGVEARINILADQRAERDRLQARLAQLGDPPPASVIRERSRALQFDRRWKSTRGCTDVTAPASRAFCTEHAKLFSQLAGATEADQIRERIVILTSAIRSGTDAATIAGTRRGMRLLARHIGLDVDDVAALLMVALAVAIEIAGMITWSVASGLAVTLRQPVAQATALPPQSDLDYDFRDLDAPQGDPREPTQTIRQHPVGPPKTVPQNMHPEVSNVIRLNARKPEPVNNSRPCIGSCTKSFTATEPVAASNPLVEADAGEQIETWLETCTTVCRRGTTAASTAYASYSTWCAVQAIEPVTQNRFGRLMGARRGITKRRMRDGYVYGGLHIKQAG